MPHAHPFPALYALSIGAFLGILGIILMAASCREGVFGAGIALLIVGGLLFIAGGLVFVARRHHRLPRNLSAYNTVQKLTDVAHQFLITPKGQMVESHEF